MRTAVTCRDQTTRPVSGDIKGSAPVGSLLEPFEELAYMLFVLKEYAWMHKRLHANEATTPFLIKEFHRVRRLKETCYEIDQPACLFSWALRSIWELNMAAHPAFEHLSNPPRTGRITNELKINFTHSFISARTCMPGIKDLII